MPSLPHLILPRIDLESPRRSTGFGRVPPRDYRRHGTELRRALHHVLDAYRARQRPVGINPSLILRIRLHGDAGVDEQTWERCGFTLLSVDTDKTLILFSTDEELAEFRRRLDEYRSGPSKEGQKNAPYAGIFSAVDEIGEVTARDRIGRLLRSSGVEDPDQLRENELYVVDIELWDLGNRHLNEAKVAEIRSFIESRRGRVPDLYIGESLVLMRASILGSVVRDLLQAESVAVVELPPQPSVTVGQILDLGIVDFAGTPTPPEGAPSIAVLDSGVATAHPMLATAVGEATSIPAALGDGSDVHGHGTKVAGLALYGDVEACIRARSFYPRLTLYSARVLNAQCMFDDTTLVTSQMRDAIRYFREQYGCRVFNLSFGDDRLHYRGGKVTPWAAVLDTLARELNVVIVVSVGNYQHVPSASRDAHVQDYPRYLLSDLAKVIEPGTACAVLTVGSLADKAFVPLAASGVALRPIALEGCPSPFTRSGPGLGDAIKPELCHFGGNYAYDGATGDPRNDIAEMSVVSLHSRYLERLFATDVGTSLATPKVAHAAARLLGEYPQASANLVRALLASSASIPHQTIELLKPLGDDAARRLCGYGVPDLELARLSDPNRVVLYADSQLGLDRFHIYEVPIPEEWYAKPGLGRLTTVLGYDPPVRHSRFDYLGLRMSFRLIRGKNLEEVAEAFRRRTQGEELVERLTSTVYDCPLEPGPRVREGSTLQRASFEIHRARNYGNAYYLVVRCERKWARDEHSPQRYAAVVVLEHTASVNLYARVRQRLRTRLRIRAR